MLKGDISVHLSIHVGIVDFICSYIKSENGAKLNILYLDIIYFCKGKNAVQSAKRY